MPYRTISPKLSPPDPEMVTALVQELRPEANLTGRAMFTELDLPDITEEITPHGARHITVLWTGWGALSPEERSNVILEAFKQAQGEEAVRRISLAIGLHPDEARRLNIL